MPFTGRVHVDREPVLHPGPSAGFRRCECRHERHGHGGKAHDLERACSAIWVPLPTGPALYFLCGECLHRGHHRPPAVWTGLDPARVALAYPVLCTGCLADGVETVVGVAPTPQVPGCCPTHLAATPAAPKEIR